MRGDALAFALALPGSGPAPLGPLAAKIVVGLLVAIGVAVLAGAGLLWPSQQKVDIPLPFQNASGGAVTTEAGHVLSSGIGDCGSPSAGQVLTAAPAPGTAGGGQCVQTLVAIDSGPNAGANTLLEFSGGPGQPNLAAGDHIRISRQVDDAGHHHLRLLRLRADLAADRRWPPRSRW